MHSYLNGGKKKKKKNKEKKSFCQWGWYVKVHREYVLESSNLFWGGE